MENSLYYTFSTIAQSLAALMGLLGAFALFRLQSIASELKDRGRTLGNSFLGHQALQHCLAKDDFAGFLCELKAHRQQVTIKFRPEEEASLDRLAFLSTQRSKIGSSVKWSFFTGAVSMLYSVGILSVVHLVAPHEAELLLLGLGIFALNVFQHSILVARLMR